MRHGEPPSMNHHMLLLFQTCGIPNIHLHFIHAYEYFYPNLFHSSPGIVVAVQKSRDIPFGVAIQVQNTHIRFQLQSKAVKGGAKQERAQGISLLNPFG